MKLKEFKVEYWLNPRDPHCAYNLGASCVKAMTVNASLFKAATADMVLTVHGGTGANNMVITALVEPTDNVVTITTPIYSAARASLPTTSRNACASARWSFRSSRVSSANATSPANLARCSRG